MKNRTFYMGGIVADVEDETPQISQAPEPQAEDYQDQEMVPAPILDEAQGDSLSEPAESRPIGVRRDTRVVELQAYCRKLGFPVYGDKEALWAELPNIMLSSEIRKPSRSF